jgi:UMF1 family MFS transporter
VIAFTLGTIGYGGSIVFYNSFLPVIAPREEQDRISARGYSMGYVGSVILLIINLLVILLPGWFGLPQNSDLPARISFLTVFVWWIGFSHFTFSRLPKYTLRRREKNSGVLMNGYRELMVVSKDVYGSFRLRTFLIGFFFIMMGLLTTMFMAATYGEKELGLDDTVLIPTILVIQLVGVAGARLFAFLSGKTGNLLTMIMAVSGWIFIITGAYFIRDAAGFVLTALVIGLVMGGSQALARSTYSKMLPETRDHTSYFSFYDVMEKMATVAGTFSFGIIEALTGSMRASVLAIGIFFILGLLFLVRLYLRENASFKNI